MSVPICFNDNALRIDLMDQAAYFLPHLLALSCSSPFWMGDDTGLKSYRLTVFDALPRTGLPEKFQSYAEYERHVDIMKIVERLDAYPEGVAHGSTLPRHRHAALPRKIRARQRANVRHQHVDVPLRDDRAPALTGPRPHLHHVVRGAHRLLIVLHDDYGVSEVPKLVEGVEQALRIGRMQWQEPDTELAFPIHAFTIPELTCLFAANGLRVVRVLGKPVFFRRLPPEVRERILADDDLTRRIVELECRYADDPGWAGSGGHIEVAGLKVR